MYGNTDIEKRIEEEETYMQWKEEFKRNLKFHDPEKGVRVLQYHWLCDWSQELQEEPTGRVMVVLPILMYELKQGVLPVEMEGELYGTKDDLEDGLLDELPDEELNEIKNDLQYCLELFESGKVVLLEE